MSSDTIRTPEARFAFAQVWKENDKGKYRLAMIFDAEAQKTPAFKKLKKAAADVVKEKWGDKPPAKLKNPFKTGDDLPVDDKTGERYAGFEDDSVVLINAVTTTKPEIVDNNVDPILDQKDFYSGCYGYASIHAFTFDVDGSKGVSFGLNNIQKIRDGERLGGSFTTAKDDFEVVEAGAESDDDAEGIF